MSNAENVTIEVSLDVYELFKSRATHWRRTPVDNYWVTRMATSFVNVSVPFTTVNSIA